MLPRDGKPEDRMSTAEMFTRFFGQPALIVPFASILETIVTQKQFGNDIRDGFRNGSRVRKAMYLAYLGSLPKGGTYAARAPISQRIDEFIGVNERPKVNEDEFVALNRWRRRMRGEYVLPPVITFIDTSITHYPANWRAMLQMNIDIPRFNTMGDAMRFSVQGFLPRWLSRLTGFSVMMATAPLVKRPLEATFPQAGVLNDVTAYSFTGVLSAVITMPLEKAWKSGLRQMNNAFTIPRMRKTMAKILKEEGVRGFFQGSRWGVLSFGIFSALVGATEYGMNNYVFPKNDKPTSPKIEELPPDESVPGKPRISHSLVI